VVLSIFTDFNASVFSDITKKHAQGLNVLSGKQFS